MKNKFFLNLMLVTSVSVTSFAQQTYIPKSSTVPRGYLEYKGCAENCPLIIFLHGAGERGDGSATQLERVKANGTPKFLKGGTFNPPFIILSPQQVTTKWNWTGDVIPFIKWALKKYPIDSTRIFITGLSMGDTWSTIGGPDNLPNYIRAAVPVSGKGEYSAGVLVKQRGIQVWAWHGDKDDKHTLIDGKRPLLGMGITNPTPDQFKVVSGGHDSKTWDEVYKPTSPIYDWFLGFKSLLPEVPAPPNSVDSVKFIFIQNSKVFFRSKSGVEISLPKE